jgi:hypothetical protein
MSGNMNFEELVRGYMRVTGLERAAAEAAVRKSQGIAEPTKTPAEVERDESIWEEAEQLACLKMLRAYNLKVYVTSQKRRAKVSPGIPDLICSKRDRALFFFWETKRQVGGRLSAEQVEFAADVTAYYDRWSGLGGRIPPLYGSGDRFDLAKFLVALNLAVFDGRGVNGISPKADP